MQPTPRRIPFSASWGVFLTALLIRLAYLFESSDSLTFFAPVLDSETYLTLARGLLHGGTMGLDYFWQPILYQSFLVWALAIGGDSIVVIKLLQVVLGSATCVLTLHLASRFLAKRWAVVAGLMAACYGPLIFYDGEILGTGLETFWAVALVLVAIDTRRVPTPRRWLTIGLLGGLAILTRPTFVPVVAAITIWLLAAIGREGNGRGSLAAAALVSVGLLVVLLPVSFVSHRCTGSYSVLPYSGGLNLYIGNNPDSDRTAAIRPGWHWDNLTMLPARHGIRPGRETSEFFAEQVLKFVQSQPLRFAGGLMTKCVQFVTSRELPRNVDLYVFREWSWILSLSLWKFGPFGFPAGVVMPLAALGLWTHRRLIPVPMWLLLLLYPATVVLVFVCARYRMPVVPLAIVSAAAGLASLEQTWRSSRPVFRSRLLALLALALACSVAGPFPQERGRSRAELDYCIGAACSRAGDQEAALAHLRNAVRIQPRYADAWNSLGGAYEELGRPAETQAAYARAVECDPANLSAHLNLGGAFYGAGEFEKAAAEYRLVADRSPLNAEVRNHLAMTLIHLGRTEQAVEVFYESLGINARDAATHNNLGSALNGLGRPREAIEHFQAAIVLNPDLYPAVDNLGAMLDGHGQRKEAAMLYTAAMERAAAKGDAARRDELKARLDGLAKRAAAAPAK